MPTELWKGNGGLDRIKYFHLYDFFNFRSRFGAKIIETFVRFQKRIGFKRSLPVSFPKKLYGGSTYWSLNREVLKYVIDYTSAHKTFLKRFNYTFCGEEIYFQTIIMNSTYSQSIFNDHLRFIDWQSGRGGYPAFLDESDLEKIVSSNKFFARKIRNDNKLREILISRLSCKSDNIIKKLH